MRKPIGPALISLAAIVVTVLALVIGWVTGVKVNAAEIDNNRRDITEARQELSKINDNLDCIREDLSKVRRATDRLQIYLDLQLSFPTEGL